MFNLIKYFVGVIISLFLMTSLSYSDDECLSAEHIKNYERFITYPAYLDDLNDREVYCVAWIYGIVNSGASNNTSSSSFLRDIERNCEVYRPNNSRYGELDCRGTKFRDVERKCEVYFYDTGLSEYGEFDCRGSDYKSIEKKCEVNVPVLGGLNSNYLDIDC